jgi:hypothetical protein
VVVASPTRTHENIVSKALDHKKAVFCEKPVAENYDKTKALYEKARKMQQPLFSAFNRFEICQNVFTTRKKLMVGVSIHKCINHDSSRANLY